MKQDELVTKSDLATLMALVESLRQELLAGQKPKEVWLTGKQVMQMLNVSESGLQHLRVMGRIPYSRIGSKLYYREQDILNILAKNYVKAV